MPEAHDQKILDAALNCRTHDLDVPSFTLPLTSHYVTGTAITVDDGIAWGGMRNGFHPVHKNYPDYQQYSAPLSG